MVGGGRQAETRKMRLMRSGFCFVFFPSLNHDRFDRRRHASLSRQVSPQRGKVVVVCLHVRVRARTHAQGYKMLRRGLPDLAIDSARAARAYIQVLSSPT